MPVSTPSLLAVVPGVTSVALDLQWTKPVSAPCASNSTAQFVPPGPPTGTSGFPCTLSHRDPRLASALIRRTFHTSSALLPDLCNMQWCGSTRRCARAHFPHPPRPPLSHRLGSPAWSSHSSSVMVTPVPSTPTSLDSFRPYLPCILRLQGLRAPVPRAHCAAHFPAVGHFLRNLSLWRRYHSVHPRLFASPHVTRTLFCIYRHQEKLPWSVFTRLGSRVVLGTCLPTSSAKCALATQPPSPGLTPATRKASDFSPFSCLTCSSTPLSVPPPAVHAWGLRWRFTFCVDKSAVMVFGPLRGRVGSSVHLLAASLAARLTIPVPWCLFCHADFLYSRDDRLFHRSSAWCLGEGVLLSLSSAVFDTYVLSSICFGLRWCRHLLGWPRASPIPAVHWELGVGDALRLALGTRILPLWSFVCHGPHFISSPFPCHYLLALFQRARCMVRMVCLRPLLCLLVPHPGHVSISSREAGSRLDHDLRHRLSATAHDLHVVIVERQLSPHPGEAVRLWGLVCWGHDHPSTDRPSRHLGGPSACPLCRSADGSLLPHISACPTVTSVAFMQSFFG